MAYVVWKLQGGNGPYAYLYESVWQDGKSRTRYVGYLGRFGGEGPGSVRPGSVVVGPDGKDLVVPAFGPAVLRQLAAAGRDLGSRAAGGEPDLGSRSEAAAGRELGSRSAGAEPDLGSRSLPGGATGREAGLGSRAGDGSGELGSRPDGAPSELGSRSGDGPEAGYDAGPEADLGSRSQPGPPTAARPHRLPDGSWGVVCREEVAVGDEIQVRTSGGQSWLATVVEVIEHGPRGIVARASRGPVS